MRSVKFGEHLYPPSRWYRTDSIISGTRSRRSFGHSRSRRLRRADRTFHRAPSPPSSETQSTPTMSSYPDDSFPMPNAECASESSCPCSLVGRSRLFDLTHQRIWPVASRDNWYISGVTRSSRFPVCRGMLSTTCKRLLRARIRGMFSDQQRLSGFP